MPLLILVIQSPQAERVSIKIYDILGNEISTIIDKYQNGGEYDAIFQSDNLSSGIYFYKIQAGNFSAVKKMLLLQ